MEVVRSHVATVLQHPALFNDTVRMNLTLGRELTDAQLWQALEVAQLADTVRELPNGLDTIVGRQGVRLSGGQRQRLAIARMVLSDPQVVILDEATSALDAETEAKLHEALRGFLKDRTTLIIAHRLSAVKQADRAYVFEEAGSSRKAWIARRVPDDEVVIIPNYYVIDDFNMSDTLNYLSSPDIIEYAVNNGWYDPKIEKSFNFRKAYCRKDRFEAIFNIARKWVILNKLSEKQYKLNDDFPFSFKPKQKVTIQVLMEVLQNHYENTQFETGPSVHYVFPDINTDTIEVCNNYNDYSCITQLRSWLPADIGNVMWIAPRYPCIQPFIPWYYGINKISPNYEKATYTEALQNYNIKNRDYKSMYPDHACWVFDDFSAKVDINYGNEIKSVREWKTNFETEIFKTVKLKEDEIIKIYKSDPDKARQMLTDLTNNFAERALIETKDKLKK